MHLMRPLSLAAAFLLLLTACGRPTKDGTNTDSGENQTADVDPVTADTAEMDFTFSKRDTDGTYATDATDATAVALKGNSATVSGPGAAFADGTVTVTAAGTYVLTGSFTGAVTVAAGETDKVQLVLNGAFLHNEQGPALYVKSADKVFVTAASGTENSLSDGTAYTVTDGDTVLDAALFSRADLTVNGDGKLTVSGNCKHAVCSKDDLVIADTVLTATAVNVALCGKDCVKLSGGTVTLTAGTDGIRSDNTEDTTRGYVYVRGSTVSVTAGNDGIQAETVLKTENATVTVTAGGGSGSYLVGEEESCKGLKAGSDIQLQGGSYTVDIKDDCIHANHTVTVAGGTYTLKSGDDGIHADTDLAVSDGTVTVEKSYEGLEGSRILISGGRLDITASDDGLNAAGGNDSSALGGRPGMGHFSEGEGEIVISGGYTLVDAAGDGVDSNGTLTLTDGVVLVSGPTNGGNGAFDYGSAATVSGGTLIALGSAGMAQGFSAAENQGALLCTFTAQNGGTPFAVCDASGKAVASFTPKKAYQSAVVTAPGLTVGGTYTLTAGGTVTGGDANGYGENVPLSGGTVLATVEMTESLYNAGGRGGFCGGDRNPPDSFGGGNRFDREPPGGFGGGMRM